jgi:cytochrome c biogenesis protein CcdA
MAFAAGLISFLSPCVLPLVPGYISFISGVSFAEIREKEGSTRFLSKEKIIILYNSIFFIIGFSIVFILLGATATWIGTFISSKISILTKLAGLVIIFFGIYMLFGPVFYIKKPGFKLKISDSGMSGHCSSGLPLLLAGPPVSAPFWGAS